MFGLTAYLQKEVSEFPIQPCSIRFSEVENHPEDINNLQNVVQKHKCSSYCIMDIQKTSKTKQHQEQQKRKIQLNRTKKKNKRMQNGFW